MRAMWLVLACASIATPARAQDQAARELFERGYAAFVDGRFPEARDLLRASLAQERRAATAFNLVLALLGTEEPVEASAICEELTAGAYGNLAGAHRREAERECARAEAEVATLIVDIEGSGEATLRVDGGAPREPSPGPLTIRVNPGPHVLIASEGNRTVEESVTLGRGQTSRVVLRVPPDLGVPDALEEQSGPPWLLIGIGGAVLAAAVVVGIVLLSNGGSDQEPISDPFFPTVTALRAPP